MFSEEKLSLWETSINIMKYYILIILSLGFITTISGQFTLHLESYESKKIKRINCSEGKMISLKKLESCGDRNFVSKLYLGDQMTFRSDSFFMVPKSLNIAESLDKFNVSHYYLFKDAGILGIPIGDVDVIEKKRDGQNILSGCGVTFILLGLFGYVMTPVFASNGTSNAYKNIWIGSSSLIGLGGGLVLSGQGKRRFYLNNELAGQHKVWKVISESNK
jgi:hypothetical protein